MKILFLLELLIKLTYYKNNHFFDIIIDLTKVKIIKIIVQIY